MVSRKIRGCLPEEPNPAWGYIGFGHQRDFGKTLTDYHLTDQNVEDIPGLS